MNTPVPYITYPVLQVRPYGLLLYERTEWDYPRYAPNEARTQVVAKSEEEKEELRKKLYTGQITEYSKKRLKRAINLLVATAEEKEAINFKTGKRFKFKVNFLTLTLPAPQKEVTDKELKKKGLDNWIKRMKRKYKLNNYVWRAERQKNGNLHFHLLTDTYLRYDHMRDDWNYILREWHFIDEFKEKWGHDSPNSTDVHSVKKIKNIASYVVKYMSKESEEKDKIEGKIWDCSKNLKARQNCEMLFDHDQNDIWENALMEEKVKEIKGDRFTLLLMESYLLNKLLTGQTAEHWAMYKRCIRTGHWPAVQDQPQPAPSEPPPINPHTLRPESIQINMFEEAT